ncbi:hypothetical protein JCM10213_004764 [Rhodosporidiobolus nylandii]
MEDDRPIAARANVDTEEDAEDAVPDWSQFAAFKRKNADAETFAGGSRSTLVPFIPKRGEKDFEPLAASSSFPANSTEATLSSHQQHLLQSSRNALYTALSSGSRHHSSRAHNSFTWRPEIGRASCDSADGLTAHGIHFGNVGHFHVERKRLELLPEEALYMCERGAVELWKEFPDEETSETKRVPMSVQQAWAECIGQYDLTPERYQVYAFLRRLGYVLVRARSIPGTSRPVYIPPPPPLYLRLLGALAHPLYFLRDTLLRAVREVQLRARRLAVTADEGKKVVKRVEWKTTRAVGKEGGRFRPLVAGGRWTSYDQLFSRLQIVPTCALHTPSRPLRAPIPHTPSALTPIASTSTVAPEDGQLSFEEHPYQPFYHVYKPVTKYKKVNPPPPDFRLVIVNGATTPLPNLFELSYLFSTLPLPDGYDESLDPLTSGPSSGPPRASPAPTAPPPPPPSVLDRALVFLRLRAPPAPADAKGGRKPQLQKKGPSPYPYLKTGRRSVLLAVVDNGTSSILRMSEGEFGKLPWVGQRRRE